MTDPDRRYGPALSPTEFDLLQASSEIGAARGMAHWATRALARRIEQTGKRVDDLTVRELRTLARLDPRLLQDEATFLTTPTNPNPEAP